MFQSLHDIRLVKHTLLPGASSGATPYIKEMGLLHALNPVELFILQSGSMRGFGRQQAFHQANILERLKSLLAPKAANHSFSPDYEETFSRKAGKQ